MILIVGAIIQFGVIFWAQNTLTQIARDTGRWEATQTSCSNASAVVTKANEIAAQSALIGFTPGMWTSSNVSVSWQISGGEPCPPLDNSQTSFVTVTIQHTVPIFFPWIPGDGNLSSSTQFRVEPQPK
jgi:hypothetical protein